MIPNTVQIGPFSPKIDSNLVTAAVLLISQMHRLMHIGHQVYQKLEGFLSCFLRRLGINQKTSILFDFFGDTSFSGAVTFLIVRAMVDCDVGVMQNIRLVLVLLDGVGPGGDICQMIYVKLLANSFQYFRVQIHFRDMTNDAMTRRSPGQTVLQGHGTQQDTPYQISDNFLSHTKGTRSFSKQ
jgi:hypothetical protein